MKLRPVWLLTLPILLLGETAGHEIVARLLDADEPRHRLLDLGTVLAALVTLSLAALLWRAAASARSQA